MQKVLNTTISLRKLELIEAAIPQIEAFKSAIGVRNERRALYVRWFDSDGDWGVGECSCRPDPYFNGEFLSGAIDVLQRHIFPLLPAEGTIHDFEKMIRKTRNWPFTTAALLDAAFDLLRRKSIPDALETWDGERAQKIPVGISLGLFESPEEAVNRVESAVKDGYRRFKFKVFPKMHLETITAVRREFPDIALGFDANGSGGEDDMAFFEKLAALSPVMLEQPFAPHDLHLNNVLKSREPDLTICLDESIASYGDLVSAHRLSALDEVNLKPGRVGGQLETLKILGFCEDEKIPAWVGGMFETGIGRTANLRVAACLPKARAHDLSPSSRYFARDIIVEPIRMDAEGFVQIDDVRPVEIDEEIFEKNTVRKIVLESASQR